MTQSEAGRSDHPKNGTHQPEPPLVTDPTTGTMRKMTPDELSIWRAAVNAVGPEKALEKIELWLDQARSIGEI